MSDILAVPWAITDLALLHQQLSNVDAVGFASHRGRVSIGVQQLTLAPLQSGAGDVTLAADAAPFFLLQPMRSAPLEKEDLCLWSSIDCV